MKNGQFSTDQIIKFLEHTAHGEPSTRTICRACAIAETTFYRRRQQFGGMTSAEAQRLQDVEQENARRRRLLAEGDLEVHARKELLANQG